MKIRIHSQHTYPTPNLLSSSPPPNFPALSLFSHPSATQFFSLHHRNTGQGRRSALLLHPQCSVAGEVPKVCCERHPPPLLCSRSTLPPPLRCLLYVDPTSLSFLAQDLPFFVPVRPNPKLLLSTLICPTVSLFKGQVSPLFLGSLYNPYNSKIRNMDIIRPQPIKRIFYRTFANNTDTGVLYAYYTYGHIIRICTNQAFPRPHLGWTILVVVVIAVIVVFVLQRLAKLIFIKFLEAVLGESPHRTHRDYG